MYGYTTPLHLFLPVKNLKSIQLDAGNLMYFRIVQKGTLPLNFLSE